MQKKKWNHSLWLTNTPHIFIICPATKYNDSINLHLGLVYESSYNYFAKKNAHPIDGLLISGPRRERKKVIILTSSYHFSKWKEEIMLFFFHTCTDISSNISRIINGT